jgi:DNA-binding LacI/PurR family transcriptional regulator
VQQQTILILNRPEKHFPGSFYFLNIKHGIDAAVDGTGYQLLVTDDEAAAAAAIVPGAAPTAGVIVIAPSIDAAFVRQLTEERMPCVVINSRPAGLSWVDLDNVRAAQAMTEHLINRGHERILCLAGFPDSQNSRDRLAGHAAALAKYGIAAQPDLHLYADFSITMAYDKLKAFLAQEHPPFTAIAAANDLMAVGAIRALTDRKMRVPEDCAVVGFDDFDFSGSFYVPLTTYRQPFRNTGFVAAKLLLRQIAAGRQSDCQVEMMGEIVIRESCGAGNGASAHE